MQKLSHFIHGEHVKGTSGLYSPVYNASTGNQISELPLASAKEAVSYTHLTLPTILLV